MKLPNLSRNTINIGTAVCFLLALTVGTAVGAAGRNPSLGNLNAAALFPTHLRCEYQVEPRGVDANAPRLQWWCAATEVTARGLHQRAYRVLVASSAEKLAGNLGDLWDSGRIESGRSIQVEYDGRLLPSRQACFWKVRVWDQDNQPSLWSQSATWTMGLLHPGDWKAKWIGVTERAGVAREISSAATATLVIRRATYGPVDGGVAADVTALVTPLVKDNRLGFAVTNEALGGDPALNRRKRLILDYELGGKVARKEVNEGDWIGIPDDSRPPGGTFAIPRYLRREFSVAQPVRHATMYVTALGLYELHLNGQRVGNHLLAPEWTNYHRRIQYQVFDVTALMRRGKNALGVILGNGWYCGGWQHWQSTLKPIYGTQPYLLAQLEITLADGSTQTILSDGTWYGTTQGPLRFAGIYEGETYDARQEMPGWDSPGYAARNWSVAAVATPETGKLVWQRSEPIRVEMELKPVAMTEPKPGVYVFDLGQNIAGWCRLRLEAPAGAVITLLHNEVLNPDGTVYMDNLHAGHLSTGDRQIDRYTCRGGGEEVYEPRFTYHGFRYVEILGLPFKPGRDFLTGVVFHTDFRQTGQFTSSSPLLNRLVQNIQWSQRGNMMGVPTDCDQRDERCGYTGDGQFFMPTAVYNFNVAAFFNKWLVDVCEDSQLPGGWFADHAPFFGPGASPNVGWSDAGIICPYIMYRTYGDTRVIRDHYAAMKRFLEWQIATSHGGTRGPELVGNGDWLNLGGGASAPVIATSYFAYDCHLMAEMAGVIGQKDDAARFHEWAQKSANAFATQFIQDDGRIRDSSQTGYALAFTMGLAPPRLKEAMSKSFANEIQRFNGHLATGFIGTPRLLPALHLAGRDDIAYHLLLTETYPGWLFEVKNGATTMWERWNGWRPGQGFADAGMNSFNHYSFGSCGEYIFSTVGGISSESPGWQHIRIQPVPESGLSWASASYDSPYGRITSSWRLERNHFLLHLTVPPNTTAQVAIPASNPASITEGNKPAASARGVRLVGPEAGSSVFVVGSGDYRFRS